MKKVTHDMLDIFGPTVKGAFRLLYPDGLTVEELSQKAQKFNWLRAIYEHFKEEV